VAFSLGSEVSYYHGKDGNIYNDNLSGGGYGISAGAGLPVGYVNWYTNTFVSSDWW